MKHRGMKNVFACLCAVITVTCALAACPPDALAAGQEQTVKSSWTDIINIDPDSGEYGKNYGWRIVSAVTVTDGVVSDVVVTGRGTGNPAVPETEMPYFEPCHFLMEANIIDASIDATKPDSVDAVDTVSGATHTSFAIKKATKEALGKWATNMEQAAAVTKAINAIATAKNVGEAVSTARAALNAFPEASSYIPADVIAILTRAEQELAANYDLKNATVTLSPSTFTYNGKAFKPAVTVKAKSGIALSSANYSVQYKNNKNAGKATVTVTGKAPFTGEKTVTFTIKKAAQTIKPAKASYSVKYNKSKAQTVSVAFKANGGGKVTYAAAKSGKVSLAKNGKVKIAKGAPAKTYSLKVKATAAAKGNYAKTTKTVTLKVVVTKAKSKASTQSLKAAAL